MIKVFEVCPEIKTLICSESTSITVCDELRIFQEIIQAASQAISSRRMTERFIAKAVELCGDRSNEIRSGLGYVILSLAWRCLNEIDSSIDSEIVIDLVQKMLFTNITAETSLATILWLDSLWGVAIVAEFEAMKQRLNFRFD